MSQRLMLVFIFGAVLIGAGTGAFAADSDFQEKEFRCETPRNPQGHIWAEVAFRETCEVSADRTQIRNCRLWSHQVAPHPVEHQVPMTKTMETANEIDYEGPDANMVVDKTRLETKVTLPGPNASMTCRLEKEESLHHSAGANPASPRSTNFRETHLGTR